MRHIFSVEVDDEKRSLLKEQGGMEHLFADVQDFESGHGHCFMCNTTHSMTSSLLSINLFASGPGCQDLSMVNQQRADHAGSYTESSESTGVSAVTYKCGFKKVRYS